MARTGLAQAQSATRVEVDDRVLSSTAVTAVNLEASLTRGSPASFAGKGTTGR